MKKTVTTSYIYVEKNIYRNGTKGTYRVKIGTLSMNAKTLTQARSYKKLMKAN